ncbi:MAG: hypothetical protein WD227_14805 [Vicinamibacterales bacterium]
MTNFSDRDLDERLASLPREASPEQDLWPVVRASMEPRTAAGRSRGWLHIAAAVLLFASGVLAGHYTPRRDGDVQPAPVGLAAAAAVQRAGTEYVAVLAELREAKARLGTDVVGQARDAALAALEGAAFELKQLGAGDRTAAGIFALAESDRQGR